MVQEFQSWGRDTPTCIACGQELVSRTARYTTIIPVDFLRHWKHLREQAAARASIVSDHASAGFPSKKMALDASAIMLLASMGIMRLSPCPQEAN